MLRVTWRLQVRTAHICPIVAHHLGFKNNKLVPTTMLAIAIVNICRRDTNTGIVPNSKKENYC